MVAPGLAAGEKDEEEARGGKVRKEGGKKSIHICFSCFVSFAKSNSLPYIRRRIIELSEDEVYASPSSTSSSFHPSSLWRPRSGSLTPALWKIASQVNIT